MECPVSPEVSEIKLVLKGSIFGSEGKKQTIESKNSERSEDPRKEKLKHQKSGIGYLSWENKESENNETS